MDFKLPDLKSGGRALTLLSSSAYLGMQLKGCSGMNREAEEDGLLLKEMIIKLYKRIGIPQVCFTFSYCDLSSLLPKRNYFSFFSQCFHARLNLCSLES